MHSTPADSTSPRQPSSIRFADSVYVQSSVPYMAGSQNHSGNTTSNCYNVIKNYNYYYGRDAPPSIESVDTSDGTADERTDSSETSHRSAALHTTSGGDEASSIFSQSTSGRAKKRHKPTVTSPRSQRSRYTSAETVMSISDVHGAKVRFQQLKFPRSNISRQVERYMRTDFFDSPYVIPLWRTLQGFISDNIQDIKARVITLGDVGYFDKEGGFSVLFNVYKTLEENLAIGYDPPQNFLHYAPPPNHKLSSSIPLTNQEYLPLQGDFKYSDWHDGKKDYFLACESPLSRNAMQAAALALPDGFTRHDTLVGALALMQEYFNEQAAGWYDYYSSDVRKQDGLVEGSLKLVTTCYTSKTYGVAVFVKDPTRQAEQVFTALYKQSEEEDIYLWERKGVVRTRSGPTAMELVNSKAVYEGQCVAIEVTAIKIRKQSFFTGDATGTMRSFMQSFSSKLHLPKTLSSFHIRSSVRNYSH
ncbi:hypothetical protein D9613_002462 [Agrocybe pediades]|uniref:Uncharacterized protein n=1 Tax=Agrocybe pediades TaxID=84607 RepID=A0A8H4QPT5_9AGAR|nr:hypothetical protein D9613_002462 [Agrocybe pediades]